MNKEARNIRELTNKVKELKPFCFKKIIDHLQYHFRILSSFVTNTCEGKSGQDKAICLELQQRNKILDSRIISLTDYFSRNKLTPSVPNISS